MLHFQKGRANIQLANTTANYVTIKADTCLGTVSFDLLRDLTAHSNIATHYHIDLNGSKSFCTQPVDNCEIFKIADQAPDPDQVPGFIRYSHYNTNSRASQHKQSILAEKYESLMRNYHAHDQDKMTAQQIASLKRLTFPYLDADDVRVHLADRSIIHKELDLKTDSILSEEDKP